MPFGIVDSLLLLAVVLVYMGIFHGMQKGGLLCSQDICHGPYSRCQFLSGKEITSGRDDRVVGECKRPLV